MRETYLIVLPWDLRFDNGGVNQVVRTLYDGIASDGRFVPHVMVLSWDATSPVEESDVTGRSIIRFRIATLPVGGAPIGSKIRYFLRLPGELLRLRRFVKRYNVTVVNCHYIGASDPIWAFAKAIGLYRGKLILSLHGLDIRTLAACTGVAWHFWRWVLRRADVIVACSLGLAAETMSRFRLKAGHVVTIHNGLNAARLSDLLGTGRGAPRVGGNAELVNLGTFEHKKGHDILLHAFRRVVDVVPTAHLTIMGRRSDTMDATSRLVEALDLEESVALHADAPHEAALKALRDADVFVLSSRNEAFSVALLEAGAFGKPIVATDVCGVAELIEDGVTGILVPSEDVERLAGGILAALANRDKALEYGRRLQTRVVTHFTAEQTCRKYLQLASDASPSAALGDSPLEDRR